MTNFFKNLPDDRLISVVKATDMLDKPLAYRFDGDDKALTDLMSELGLQQTVADKLLIAGQVLRECAHRGLQIPRSNEPTADDSEDFSPIRF